MISTPSQNNPVDGEKIVGTGFYRDAKPCTFGPNEWLDLLIACQDGRATCMRVMEYIERETVPMGAKPDDKTLDDLTNAFLRWPLPESVRCDLVTTLPNCKNRVGTNLLSFTEAKQMFSDILGPLVLSSRIKQKIIDLQSPTPDSALSAFQQAAGKTGETPRTEAAEKANAARFKEIGQEVHGMVAVSDMAHLESQLASMTAERDEAQAKLSNTTANLVHADNKITELQDYIRVDVAALQQKVEEMTATIERQEFELSDSRVVNGDLRQKLSTATRQNEELVTAFREVIRVSDRDTDIYNKAKSLLPK